MHTHTQREVTLGYLLADVAEAALLTVALVGLPQDRVEGFVAVTPGSPGIARDGEHSHVHLRWTHT